MSNPARVPYRKELIPKLEAWVKSHPEHATAKHVNMTTGKTFTIKEILEELIKERDTDYTITDSDTLRIKENIARWLKV